MLSQPPLRLGLVCFLVFLLASAASAFVHPDPTDPWRARAIVSEDLQVRSLRLPANQLPAVWQGRETGLQELGISTHHAHLDLRSGRWATLLLSEPFLPGSGKGNHLTWELLGTGRPAAGVDLEALAWDLFLDWVGTHRQLLAMEPEEIVGQATVDADGRMIRIHGTRRVGGLPVLGSAVTAVIRQGNLILFGTERWGDPDPELSPRLSAADAADSLRRFLDPLWSGGLRSEGRLVLVPTAPARLGSDLHTLRPVWELEPEGGHEVARWRAWVDATSGEILRFFDTTRYARQVQGGVFPISNDGQEPGGDELPGFPMPYVQVDTSSGIHTADGGGNLPDAEGELVTSLEGLYVRMDDRCGTIREGTSKDVLDLGTGPGTDCEVAPGASPGNTRSTRTTYYELNRMMEMARGHLPGNDWLSQPLLMITNLSFFCNAGYGGDLLVTSLSNDVCANTGEIPAIVDHELGHGLDEHDATADFSFPAEGIADLYAALRTNRSCIGRGYLLSGTCAGYGDPCLECSGIRDIDWEKHESGSPRDVDWADANCQGIDHCLGLVYSEAVWDLIHRDLPTFYEQDNNTALEIVTRLTYLGAGNVVTWFEGANGSAGCGATGGYLQYLAADDDNGDLADGTPHMAAISAAFDRHGIACPTPIVQDSGCADRPAAAPEVTATPRPFGLHLDWTPVPGASRYKVYRSESPLACDSGKILLGETTTTEWLLEELQNGRPQSIVVAAFGASDSCMGPASACLTAAAGPTPVFADGFESGDCSAWSEGPC